MRDKTVRVNNVELFSHVAFSHATFVSFFFLLNSRR